MGVDSARMPGPPAGDSGGDRGGDRGGPNGVGCGNGRAVGNGRALLFDRVSRSAVADRRWCWHDLLFGVAVVVIAAAIGFWVGRMTAPIANERPVVIVGPAKWT